MKSFISQAAALLVVFSVVTSALLVPPFIEADPPSRFLTSVPGSFDPDRVTVNFQTACDGCFIGTDDGIEVILTVGRAEAECTGTGLRLNGKSLSLNSDILPGVIGDLTVNAKFANGLGSRDFFTEWSLLCLDDTTSLLGVHFYDKDDNGDRQSVGGFSTSFQQRWRPSILKIDPTLTSARIENLAYSEWTSPSSEDSLKVIMDPTNWRPPVSPGLREQLEKLSKLESEQDELNKQIKESEAGTMKTCKAEFAQCSTLKCYLQTAVKEAPTFGKLIVNHFKHHGRDQAPMEVVLEPDVAAASVPGLLDLPEAVDVTAMSDTPTESTELDYLEHPHPPFHFGGPPPWAKDGELPPWGEGPPPWIKDGKHPPWGTGPPPWIKDGIPPPWARPGSHPPPWAHHDGPPRPFYPHGRPSFSITSTSGKLSGPEAWKYHLVAALTSFATVSILAGLLFICVKRRIITFRDPRRRADCAAKREEWKRKKAYRKAACKYRWVTFIQRFRWPATTSELDEKPEYKWSKTQNEGSAFGREIGSLRAAHEFVGELVRAEEGRAQNLEEPNAGDRASITETLPAYSAPPSYGRGMDGDISVIDGFTGYTPSSTDRTPASSVIDCSPRMSFDTQRTTVTRGDEERRQD